MKILIAYDGTPGADAALDDLARAGLPKDVDAIVLTVADASIALASRAFAMAATGMAQSDHRMEQAAAAVDHARTVAAEAATRVRTRFPDWHVSSDAWGGSPASAIVLKADLLSPDLIFVGSRGRARATRLLLGSVARKVATEARCSVRVARSPVGAPDAPVRILVGHDGGGGGQAALLAAAARTWPVGSQIRAMAVQDAEVYTASGREFGSEAIWPRPEMPADRSVLRKLLDQDVERAQRAGLAVTAEIAGGAAAGVLVRTAARWKADCVFVGATSRSRAARFLLGAVSSVVADRARCSVEVVRPRQA